MKDLVSVGQGGAAILNKNTPAHVKGMFTCGLQTCVALTLEKEDSVLLMHIDEKVSVSSLQDLIRDFGDYKDYSITCLDTRTLPTQSIDRANAGVNRNLEKVSEILGFPIDIRKANLSPNGSTLIEFGKDGNNPPRITKRYDVPEENLKSRDITNPVFRNYRDITCNITRILPDLRPIELEYNGKSLTKLPILDEQFTQDIKDARVDLPDNKYGYDFEKLRHYPELYNAARIFKGNLAIELEKYLTSKQDSEMPEYTIPLITEDKKRLLTSLTEQFGEESDLKYRRETDWSLSAVVKLPSKFLSKEVRSELELDRYRIERLTEERKEFLKSEIPEITIESEKDYPTKNLVTFPVGERNKGLVDAASNNAKWLRYKSEHPEDFMRASPSGISIRESQNVVSSASIETGQLL
jgi:hypothetical protein